MKTKSVQIKNKKATYEYFLVETFTAGIVLTGTEIKSIRSGKASIMEAYCAFNGHELFVRNMNISPYDHGSYMNHEPKRERKLLLNKRELKKLRTKFNEKGYTIIPVLLYLSDKGYAKLDIALAKGKKQYDKRESIKDRDILRDAERERMD